MSKAHGSLTLRQCASFVMEEKTAAFYLMDGLHALHSLDKSTGFYPLAFTLSASGLERLLKLVLVAGRLKASGEAPTRRELRQAGHDLRELAARAAEADRKVKQLLPDPILGLTLATLNDFAKEGRYLYLDSIVDPGRTFADPKRCFRQLEDAIIEETGGYQESWLWGYALVGMWPTFIRRRNEFIVDRMLRLVTALSSALARLLDVPPGYTRAFAEPTDFGKPLSHVQFRKLVNSDVLKRWELEVESLLGRR